MGTPNQTIGSEAKPAYHKELGFWTVVFLATGGILGPAVGFTPISVLALAGPSGIISWIIAFALMLAVAMSYPTFRKSPRPKSGIFPLNTQNFDAKENGCERRIS